MKWIQETEPDEVEAFKKYKLGKWKYREYKNESQEREMKATVYSSHGYIECQNVRKPAVCPGWTSNLAT